MTGSLGPERGDCSVRSEDVDGWEVDALLGEAERWPLHDEHERSCRRERVQPELIGVPVRRRAPTAPATVPHQHGTVCSLSPPNG